VFDQETVLVAEADLERCQKLRDVRDAVDAYGSPGFVQAARQRRSAACPRRARRRTAGE
jgi:hypothetical protein